MENADRKRALGNFRITIGDVHSHGFTDPFPGMMKIRGGNLEEKQNFLSVSLSPSTSTDSILK